ncbi:MAG: PqqD family protein [Chloroflexi bacterium]|nr:PqqD family protein [Chloroflexota bacterium]MBU1661914.1 PqqD family protein [Chloroflexota bacterium]
MSSNNKDASPPGSRTAQAKWRPLRRPDVISQAAGEETLLYDPVADAVHVLNPTAQTMWQLCDGHHAVSDMATHFQAHFTGTSGYNIVENVKAILEAWRSEKLVL